MIEEESEALDRKRLSVPIWLLITICITFLIGLVAGLVINKLLSPEQISFSTVALISFVFTVALGASAIILAVITIVLSRNAEDALIRRSDEGIRLQNDVFVRTSEVLSKIQASTGVTEKRIEDIIAGRTGPLVEEAVAKSKLDEAGVSKGAVEKISKDLAESLKSEIMPLIRSAPSIAEARLVAIETKQNKKEAISKRWREFRSEVVNEIRQVSGVEIISETEGRTRAEKPEEFWDAMIKINNKGVGLDIHTKDQLWEEEGTYHNLLKSSSSRREYIGDLTCRALEDNIEKIIIIFDEDIWSQADIVELHKLIDIFDQNSKCIEIVPISGSPKDLAKKIVEIVNEEKGK